MIQWEECSLNDATHVDVNGEVHQIKAGGKVERSVDFGWIDILVGENKWANIPKEAFPLLGIKPLKEIKQEPIEFEATFAKYLGNWIPLYTMHDGFLYEDNKKAKFKCIQILEDEKK